ncbi:MAG: helix-hairpin-helix domain-containing protein [Deltaproteobacteria bacterium]|nr:helix-hairpin-helix domain-containing protein [Deltaproteobacteria bacterium]
MLTIFFFRYPHLINIPFFTQSPEIEKIKPLPIAIEIVGEIEKSGIYCFEDEVSLGEVIERAGGLKSDVVLTEEHFLTEVSNGAKISISSNPSSCTVGMMGPEKRLLFFIPININTASVEELVVVPAIGEKTARAIIYHREKHGNFTSLDELKKVSGIGNYNFKKMKKHLSL